MDSKELSVIKLAFSEMDILNCSIGNEADGRSIFRTRTSRKTVIGSRKVTVVESANGSELGSLDWKDKTITINGEEKRVDALLTRQETSLRMQWRWFDTTYTIFSKSSTSREVRVMNNASNRLEAIFTQGQSHLFHKNEMATLEVDSLLHNRGEDIFILLVLLFTQVKRENEPKSVEIPYIALRG